MTSLDVQSHEEKNWKTTERKIGLLAVRLQKLKKKFSNLFMTHSVLVLCLSNQMLSKTSSPASGGRVLLNSSSLLRASMVRQCIFNCTSAHYSKPLLEEKYDFLFQKEVFQHTESNHCHFIWALQNQFEEVKKIWQFINMHAPWVKSFMPRKLPNWVKWSRNI